jgi:hypothetical protein
MALAAGVSNGPVRKLPLSSSLSEAGRRSHRSSRVLNLTVLAVALTAVWGLIADPGQPAPRSNAQVKFSSWTSLIQRETAQRETGTQPTKEPLPERVSAAEFARIVREFSEEGGYFLSDNFTSNETAYLHVVSKLRKLGGNDGAYVGVGPEQNFTYLAKLRPRIAFIVDIRRQAMIQHLMFKAIFQLSPNRLQFLSRLFSRPLASLKDKAAPKTPSNATAVTELLDTIARTPGNESAYAANMEAIRRIITEDFQFPLNRSDQASLDYVYKAFFTDGLDIAFKMDGFQSGWFPSLKELILQPDQFGKLGNFLASHEDYDFVRGMHERNLIIPVVGDFAGKKALAAIASYLRKRKLTVNVFYTSNVEQYLFQDGVFPGFVENVRQLPLDERSLFIRSVLNQRYYHPARQPGHMLTTILQRITVFLKDYDSGLYKEYDEMVTSHYIAGDTPTQ